MSIIKSVKSKNTCIAGLQAYQSVAQIGFDIVKAHGWELKVDRKEGYYFHTRIK